jgi:hypothetical protein
MDAQRSKELLLPARHPPSQTRRMPSNPALPPRGDGRVALQCVAGYGVSAGQRHNSRPAVTLILALTRVAKSGPQASAPIVGVVPREFARTPRTDSIPRKSVHGSGCISACLKKFRLPIRGMAEWRGFLGPRLFVPLAYSGSVPPAGAPIMTVVSGGGTGVSGKRLTWPQSRGVCPEFSQQAVYESTGSRRSMNWASTRDINGFAGSGSPRWRMGRLKTRRTGGRKIALTYSIGDRTTARLPAFPRARPSFPNNSQTRQRAWQG